MEYIDSRHRRIEAKGLDAKSSVHRIGLMSSATGESFESWSAVIKVTPVDSLGDESLGQMDCLLLDVRSVSASTYQTLSSLNIKIPVIALVDPAQAMPDGFPFGCYFHELLSLPELNTELGLHRIQNAIYAYTDPTGSLSRNHPIYPLLQSIANFTSDWVFVKNLDHQFQLASERFAEISGVTVDSLLGKNDLDIGLSAKHVLGDKAYEEKGFWVQDDEATSSGEVKIEDNPNSKLLKENQRWTRTKRVPLKNFNDEVYALLVCVRDITEAKLNESMLEQRTAMLDIATDEKQSALHSRKLAEDEVVAKTRFLAAATHDLRQPLHAAGLFLDALARRPHNSENSELVSQIRDCLRSLSQLFNACLDISRLDSGLVDEECLDISVIDLFDGLSEGFRQQCDVKNLSYSEDLAPIILYTDPILIGRILRNLLSNAVQNTEFGGVTIQCLESNEAYAVITLEDTGIGIPLAERERIFEEFHQLYQTPGHDPEGLGLGLAIVKRLSELLHVKVIVDSTEGLGSRFTLHVPLGDASGTKPSVAANNPTPIQAGRLLILDDNDSIRAGMEHLMESYGFEVRSGKDLKSALALLNQSDWIPDLLIVDYRLSNEETGLAAVQVIRKQFNTEIPAVLVTGDSTPGIDEEAAGLHMPMLSKPAGPTELLETISKLLDASLIH